MTRSQRKHRQRGQVLPLVALCLIPMFGLMGLAVDVGWAYFRKEAARGAADSAALAAALAANGASNLNCGPGVVCQASTACPSNPAASSTNNLMSGCLYAQANGFVTGSRQSVSMAANTTSSPVSGISPGYWVTATVSESIPTLFSALMGNTSMTVTATATAGVFRQPGGCVYVLGSTGSDITASGTPVLQTGCGVYVDSSSSGAVTLAGNAGIEATGGATVNIVGNWVHSGNAFISPTPTLGAPVAADPFASLQPPPVGSCDSTGVNLSSSQSYTFDQSTSVICGPINLSGQSSVTFQPGVYVLKGGINMSGQTSLSGTGVTLYLQSGSISMAGGATINLGASTSGPYQGILIYQDRQNSSGANLSGGASQIMNGVLYFPNASLSYSGGSGTNATSTTLVSKTLTLSGNSYIKQAASAPQSGAKPNGVFLIG